MLSGRREASVLSHREVASPVTRRMPAFSGGASQRTDKEKTIPSVMQARLKEPVFDLHQCDIQLLEDVSGSLARGRECGCARMMLTRLSTF